MQTGFLVALLVGLGSAAIQQQRSPVYQPQVTSTGGSGATSTVNSTPLMKSSTALPISPMTPPPPNGPVHVAEARESIASEASMPQGVGVNPSTPSQNYYVYYYPHQGQAGSVGQPNSSSIWSWSGWDDVLAGVGSVALVAIGSGILYSRYGTEVKSRALRELKDLTTEDAARMARGVLRALEKFSSLNNDME